MRHAVIVIGSNYGDEGKGLAAYSAAKEHGTACLNVLINGGAQRGHTVDLPDGRRHIFRHFGAATLAGAASCLDRDFMVNPILFAEELEELRTGFPELLPKVYVSEDCRVTLPYDMMVNQIIEDARGNARHGSCGLGIFETRHRYEVRPGTPRFGALLRLGADGFRAFMEDIRATYLPERLREAGVECPEAWNEILLSDAVIENAWDDLLWMRDRTETYADWTAMADGWPLIVFEAGQGLALDEFNKAGFPHLTPSRTTSYVSAERIAALGGETDVEIRYVTRAYLTRHGAGPLPGECPKDTICEGMIDRTNMPNPYQQTIRYAPFDLPAVLGRIEKDLHDTRRILPASKKTVLLTHLNETNGTLYGSGDPGPFLRGFEHVYVSDRADEVRRIR